MARRVLQVVGVLGTAEFVVLFAIRPYYITPDKLFVFLLFLFMAFRHARELVIRLGPFVALLLVYETFRGLAPLINHRVEYAWMADMDARLFGFLPTARLQELWWHGQVGWLECFLYAFYLGHFLLPIAVALLIWRFRESAYWRYVTSLVVVSFAGFVTFLAFPAAPPWMASERGLIEPIERIGYDLWATVGVRDFRALYSEISPNSVAAVPSLHAAYAVLVALFVLRLFGPSWGALCSVYPLAVCVGTVYLGEHYAIDVILGALYAVGAYLLASRLFEPKAALGEAAPDGEPALAGLPTDISLRSG